MRYLTGLIIAAILISAIGCGHKKSGAVPTSLPKGEQTRALTPGDTMTYDLSMSVTDAKGMTQGPILGATVVRVTKGFKHGPLPSNIVNTYHVSDELPALKHPIGQIAWAGQDSKGATYFLGKLDQGKEWALVKDKEIKPDTPAVLSDGSSWSYTVHLSDGTTQTITNKIVGVEKVTTPAGDFEAYKTETENKQSDGRLAKGIVWLRPDLPRPVKVRLDLSNTNQPKGSITSIEQDLRSYKLGK